MSSNTTEMGSRASCSADLQAGSDSAPLSPLVRRAYEDRAQNVRASFLCFVARSLLSSSLVTSCDRTAVRQHRLTLDPAPHPLSRFGRLDRAQMPASSSPSSTPPARRGAARSTPSPEQTPSAVSQQQRTARAHALATLNRSNSSSSPPASSSRRRGHLGSGGSSGRSQSISYSRSASTMEGHPELDRCTR